MEEPVLLKVNICIKFFLLLKGKDEIKYVNTQRLDALKSYTLLPIIADYHKILFTIRLPIKTNVFMKLSEELDTSMSQKSPGVPNLCILSFKGGFHGRTLGLLSCSNSR